MGILLAGMRVNEFIIHEDAQRCNGLRNAFFFPPCHREEQGAAGDLGRILSLYAHARRRSARDP